MTNLRKRILTSLIILPFSFFFITKGGFFLLSFLLFIFFIANYELFSAFNKKFTIFFLNLVLILSLFTIFYLTENNEITFLLLIWVIILSICSDVGGYIFGKIFKWKKLTKISPKKTFSGALGSFIFSIFSLFIISSLDIKGSENINFLEIKFFFITIIFSLVAQLGDLTISYFKRLEKIKDTGSILPGHGGIFDRIDGLMFVLIITIIFYKVNILP
jgi:phosphatidate cytidylyltransferase